MASKFQLSSTSSCELYQAVMAAHLGTGTV